MLVQKPLNLRYIFLLFLVVSLKVDAIELKIATIAPEGSEWMQEHRLAAAAIKDQTEGRVILKFYGGGVMGNDKKVLRKIRIGQLQGGAFASTGLAEKYPDIVLYGLPFLFNNQNEVDFIRENLDDELIAGLEDAGFVSFGFAGGGFANFMSNSPVANNNELKGKKIWVPEGDVMAYTALKSLDLSTVILPLSDVLTGLQTGLISIIAAPPSAALMLQWYTKVKYINPIPFAYTAGLMAISLDVFNRISKQDQEIVRVQLTQTYKKLDLINRTDNDEAMTVLLGNGLKLFDTESEALDSWRIAAEKTNKTIWEETSRDKTLLQRMNNLLLEFRLQQFSDASIPKL